jgi:hypothetical protein
VLKPVAMPRYTKVNMKANNFFTSAKLRKKILDVLYYERMDLYNFLKRLDTKAGNSVLKMIY